MQLFILRACSAVAIALVYMLYDVFNRRNVPSVFAYATLAYGAVLTALYLNVHTILVSSAIAAVILGVGYLIYRIGQLGAADVMEFAALSLILPILAHPVVARNIGQLGMPFALSLIINAGVAAIVIVPIYYIPKARKVTKRPLLSFVSGANMLTALLAVIAYLSFMLFLSFVMGISYLGIAILAVILASSFFVMMFSGSITMAMVRQTSMRELEEGDIIAINLMGKQSIRNISRKIHGFGRLVTYDIIAQIKRKRIHGKLPVYKEAMPFAVPIFIGLVLSLLVGNLILVVLGL